MNLIPYNIFVYLNYVIYLAIAVSGWLISPESQNINLFLTIAGLASLVSLSLSSQKEFPPISLLPARIVQLILFVIAIVTSFSHYFFQVDNSNLILLVLIAPAISLLTLIFVNTDAEKDN
jgi:cytochrome b561